MSINSMVNAALARRPDTIPLQQVPNTFNEIATAAMTPQASLFPYLSQQPKQKQPLVRLTQRSTFSSDTSRQKCLRFT